MEEISVRGTAWKDHDFSKYDVVLHVAGIAHVEEKHIDSEHYETVNCKLAADIASKAKVEGIQHFVFISSMSVYGLANGIITEETKPNPKSLYGKSKLHADRLIFQLIDKNFKVAILRPPMIYGPN
ncbi:nucleoside-diphosphate-sugar epimerase [Paenibacillus sp. PastF-3]|uniref:NAD-dependent epimerase/dehydratase family protein n=1 Tax=Paenibacillus sp. PastF-3 TaxID=2940626 RepID=UPI0024742B34|nr:NAD-dependent epimerase/dehydratase family protein [Paenibacillus sp. PastF-3]MDH6373267.1 nucleoside-diphosphate-sugar epimerase [Paenibacillus sp. PastF-3]